MTTVGGVGSGMLLFLVAGVLVLLALGGVAIWLTTRRRPGAMPPGWYPDPSGQAALRWFDGTRWTSSTHD